MSGRLSGKVAVITGGASGIGQAACRRIASEGCHIAVIDVDGEGAQRTAEDHFDRALQLPAGPTQHWASSFHLPAYATG